MTWYHIGKNNIKGRPKTIWNMDLIERRRLWKWFGEREREREGERTRKKVIGKI